MDFYEKKLWSHISFSCTGELVRARQLYFFHFKSSAATIWNILSLDKREKSLKPGAHEAILVGRFRSRWMFYTKIVSVGSVGSYISLGFDESIHLNSNRSTKIFVCAPGFSAKK